MTLTEALTAIRSRLESHPGYDVADRKAVTQLLAAVELLREQRDRFTADYPRHTRQEIREGCDAELAKLFEEGERHG